MFTYILAAVLATLSPLAALGVWNRAAAVARRNAGRFGMFGALALAACSAPAEIDGCGLRSCDGGTGGGPSPTQTTTTSDAGTDAALACDLLHPACPAGSYSVCNFEDLLATCCDGNTATNACARPAGILTHVGCETQDGGACGSGECAIGLGGAITCCEPGSPTDPCSKEVK